MLLLDIVSKLVLLGAASQATMADNAKKVINMLSAFEMTHFQKPNSFLPDFLFLTTLIPQAFIYPAFHAFS